MALPDLTGQNIENTYQRVLHTDGVSVYDGTGSAVVLSYTGSFTGDGSNLTGIAPTPPGGGDRDIQFNDGGNFGGDSSFVFTGNLSLQQGRDVTAQGQYSHAEGSATTAVGDYSHAEGGGTQAIGAYSHAEGLATRTGVYGFTKDKAIPFIADGLVTLREDYGDLTQEFKPGHLLYLYDPDNVDEVYTGVGRKLYWIQSSAYNVIGFLNSYTQIQLVDTSVIVTGTFNSAVVSLSHGVVNHSGGDVIIPADYSHTEGSETATVSIRSHAEGRSTQAAGDMSHAEGFNTIAAGDRSHAEGESTIALGTGCHTEGLGTIASGAYQHVQGQYNITSSAQSAFIIGNGTANSVRNNLVFASGSRFEITGSLSVTGSAFIRNLASTAQTSVVTINATTGQLFLTASSALGGGGGGTPGGANTTIQFNDAGAFSGSGNFTFNKSTNAVSLTGSLTTSGSIGINTPADAQSLLHIDGGPNVNRVIMDADNNVARIFSFRTDNSQRWAFRVDGNETGANAGANFELRRYADNGVFIDAPISLNRSTGNITLNHGVTGTSFTGSLFGTASWAITASHLVGGGGSITKAGAVASASFGGSPFTASVTFGSAFVDTQFAVTLTGEDDRVYVVNNKQTTGFTINTNSSVLFSGSVYWIAIPYSS